MVFHSGVNKFVSWGLQRSMLAIAATVLVPSMLLFGGLVFAQDSESKRNAKSKASQQSEADEEAVTVASRPEFSVPLDSEKARKQVGRIMNVTTVDLIQLRRITKQVHWNVTGQHFHAVHVSTDELADRLDELTDKIAERALAVGVAVDGRVVKISSTSGLADGPNGFTPDFMMVRLLANRLAQMSERLGERIEQLGKVDLVAQDLLIDAKQVVDKYHWQYVVQTRDLNGE